jgi:hypothetical protein
VSCRKIARLEGENSSTQFQEPFKFNRFREFQPRLERRRRSRHQECIGQPRSICAGGSVGPPQKHHQQRNHDKDNKSSYKINLTPL